VDPHRQFYNLDIGAYDSRNAASPRKLFESVTLRFDSVTVTLLCLRVKLDPTCFLFVFLRHIHGTWFSFFTRFFVLSFMCESVWPFEAVAHLNIIQ
jgi:hypothetical protein